MTIIRDGRPYDSKARGELAAASVAEVSSRFSSARRRDIPRPEGPSRTEVIMAALRREPLPHMLSRFCAEHPDILHMVVAGESAYLLSNPDHIVEVFATHGKDTMKSRALQNAKALLGEGLLTSEGDFHLRQRRMIQPAFHRARIAAYSDQMVACAQAHGAAWRDGDQLDLAADMSRLTLQIVGQTLFGADLSEEAAEVGEALNVALEGFPALMGILAPVRAKLRLPPFPAMERAGNALDAVVLRMIAEHREKGDTGDLLSMLISAQEDGVGMDDAQLRDEAMTLVLAGHETTAMALSWMWLLLSRNPDRAAWLHEEVDAIEGTLSMADLPRLPRTRAVMAEAMRIYPPAWTIGRRMLAEITLGEWTIPAGSLVLAPQLVMHRHPDYWAEPMAFRPERWLDPAGEFDETAPGQPRGAWFPFGWGKRQCIGDQFAWTEGTLVLATLAREWAPQVLPSADPQPVGAVTLRPSGGLPVILRRR